MKTDWKKKAEGMFFLGGSSINDIAAATGKSRQAVSGHLKALPGFAAEKDRRKQQNRDSRKEYKREKNREYRMSMDTMGVTGETMKREHDIAAMLLSHERY